VANETKALVKPGKQLIAILGKKYKTGLQHFGVTIKNAGGL
jgi:hypothetical protein